MPTPNGKWTQVLLSDEAVKQLIQVIPNLPGGDAPNYPVRLRIDRYLSVEGPNKDQKEWTSIPVQTVNVNGNPVSIGLNREYLLKALRFGLKKLEIEDPLSPMVLSNGGKKMVISPLNPDGGKATVTAPAQPTAETTTPASDQPTSPARTEKDPATPPSAAGAQHQTETERTTDTVKAQSTATPLAAPAPETTAPAAPASTPSPAAKVNGNGQGKVNEESGPAFEAVVEQVEKTRGTLRQVITDLTETLGLLKAAEKEHKTANKEIASVRQTLRSLQDVRL